jgi:hypothetical protein
VGRLGPRNFCGQARIGTFSTGTSEFFRPPRIIRGGLFISFLTEFRGFPPWRKESNVGTYFYLKDLRGSITMQNVGDEFTRGWATVEVRRHFGGQEAAETLETLLSPS